MSTGRPGANLVIPMGPLVAPADSDVLSVQRLDALNSSFHRGYMQQKQQAEANAKLPLIQAQAKAELEDLRDPNTALIRKKGKQVLLGQADAALRQQDNDTKMSRDDFKLREQTTLGAIEQIERSKWKIDEMTSFLAKEGVSFDYNPNTPPEETAAKLRQRISEYRDFVRWSSSARSEWEQLKPEKRTITSVDKDGTKRTYEQYFSRDLNGPVPDDKVKQLQMAQLTTFEQWSAFRKAFTEPQGPPAQPVTSGYQPNGPLVNPNPVPAPTPVALPSAPAPMATESVPDPSGFEAPPNSVQIGYEEMQLPNAPAEIIRQFSALLEAPGLLKQIKRSFDKNRASGAEIINVPGLKNEDGTQVTFDLAPIIGVIKNANAWDKQAQELKQAVRASVSTFARGVFREVGVLSDADIRRYEALLPGAKTTEGAAQLLFAILDDTLDRSAMMSAGLNYDTKQGRILAKTYGFTKEDLDAGMAKYGADIQAGREERQKLIGATPGAPASTTPVAAADSFVKQYGVQPPPPGWGLAKHPEDGRLIYLDAATREWRDTIPAQ